MVYRALAPAALLATTVAVSSVAAQTVRLNGPLVQPLAGDVVDYRISPDATHVAFRADQAQDDVFELFAAPLDGSAPGVRLHALLPESSEADVQDFAFAAGGLVVYRADLGTDEQVELYAAPRTGSASPTLLSGPLVAGGDVLSFQLTLDGTRVVFRADKLVNDRFELFSVPVDGSAAPLRLDTVNRKCVDYRVSPDGTFVLFSTGIDVDVESLHRVPIDASQAPVQVADSGPPGFVSYTFFESFAISSDSQHASFVTDELFFDGFCGKEHVNLYGIDVESPPPAQLNATEFFCYFPPHVPVAERVVFLGPSSFSNGELTTIRANGTGRVVLGTSVLDFVVSPDEARVVFRAGSAPSCTLYSAPVDGSAAATALVGPGAIETPQVSPGGSLVCFIATDPGTSFRGLYAVPISGGAPLLLNGPPIAGRGAEDFAISPAGGALVYREDRTTAGVFELWSVGLDLVPHRLSGELSGFRDVLSFQIAPDGQRVVHLADRNADQTNELFGTPIDSESPTVQYNEPLPGGPVLGDVLSFQVTSDGSGAVYRADQDVDEFFELYSTPVSGAGDPVRLTSPLSDASDVKPEFALTPSGERVIFQYATGLYSVPVNGAEAPLLLDLSGSGFPFPLAFVGDDVVYRVAASDLRRIPVDGSGPPIVLANPTGPLRDFQLSPDGASVVYRAGDSTIELYRVPSDGGAPPVKLNPPLPSVRVVDSFQISPDSTRVVYRADQNDVQLFELFSVPIDGSATAVKVSDTMVSGGDVTTVAITADSARVVYRADQEINNTFELYGAPIDGSAVALRLTPLVGGRSVESDFVLSASGAFAVYRADALTNDVQELFAATTASVTTPLRLNAPLVGGGDVLAFEVLPDLSRIVYQADQATDDTFQLYSRPTAGPVVGLGSMPAFGDVLAFRIDADRERAVYLADPDQDEVMELFTVPLDGSAPPRKRHAALPATGDVQADFVSIPGNGVLFRADTEGDEVFELFAALGHAPALAPAAAPTATRSIVR